MSWLAVFAIEGRQYCKGMWVPYSLPAEYSLALMNYVQSLVSRLAGSAGNMCVLGPS